MQRVPDSQAYPQIILITGSMASGKSSVAQALAERLPTSVHLRGDLFRRMIVNGRAEMSIPLSTEAQRQLQLRYDLAAETAKRYAQAGWTVIYQDIMLGPALTTVTTLLRPFVPAVVVLCPRAEVLAARDQARSKQGYPDRAAVEALDRALRTETPRVGYWLDNSDLTVAETVDAIVQNLPFLDSL
jgi:predicted kinase